MISEIEKTTYDSSSLKLLLREIPNLLELIKFKTICDFGCGEGDQAIALAKAGANFVMGVDTSEKWISLANEKLKILDSLKVQFLKEAPYDKANYFDIVISLNSMEHFSDPLTILMNMKRLLRPEGILIITFGPPWYAPYGAHMQFFSKIPWIHLIFPEKWVMKWRSEYRKDNAKKYTEVESGLGKLSVAQFENYLNLLNFKIDYKKYTGIKGMSFLTKIPILRELFINHVTVILRK